MSFPRLRLWLPRLLLGIAAAACVAALTLRGTTGQLDTWIYDRVLAGMQQPVDDRIVLVVVDDKSLAGLGRWPWPRSVHAELVRKLSAARPRGIAFDVLFSEPSRADAASDDALAQAMRDAGMVVSPVAAEASEPGGTTIEVLPLSQLIDASAALGHVEVDIEADGIARQAHLYAGLGSAHWPALALALRDLDPAERRDGALPGLRSPAGDAGTGSPYLWHRDYRILLPYAPGGFRQVSYIDALRGAVPATLFERRWILVGVTAGGVAREVLVPEIGGSNRLPGVEYHANLLNALLQDSAIVPLTPARQAALGILLVLLPLGIYRSHHRVRRAWVATLAAVAVAVLACLLLLRLAGQWFAPSPALLVICGGHLLWVLLRLRKSQRQASSDALTRLANRRLLDITLEREVGAAQRSNRPMSLLLIDVDHFKPYNDYYGHQSGDAVLRKVSETIQVWSRRPRDLAARYGGDELALVLPESPAHAAAAIGQAILDEVRALAIPHAQSPIAPHVTLSIGIATYYPIREGHEVDLLKRADAALYRAKREGRNRVHAASSVAGAVAGAPSPS